MKKTQSGVALLEALVGILIFSIGILALMGLQAQSIRNTVEAKYRNEAAYLANQIIGQMWVDRANLSTYDTGGGANRFHQVMLRIRAGENDAATEILCDPAGDDGKLFRRIAA